jgi:transposase
LSGIAVGRRNWTFFGSDNGGKTAAVLTSFMATCGRLKIDPWAYLRDTLGRIAQHPVTKFDELLPGTGSPQPRKPAPQTQTLCVHVRLGDLCSQAAYAASIRLR